LNKSRPITAFFSFVVGPAEASPVWQRTRPLLSSGLIYLSAATVLCLLVFPCFGQAPSPSAETVRQTNEKIQSLATTSHPALVETSIGAGDLLHIDVFDVPELSRDVRVSPAGEIGFPLIPGQIQAAGLTTFQLENDLDHLLVENGLVSHPQVSVLVREQNSQPVSVVGAVAKPMVYQVIRPTTLLEVLAAAGGISDEAGSVVLVTRATAPPPTAPPAPGASADAPETQTMTIRLQDLLESGDPSYNIQIFGGDVVSVPRAGIVYVMGAGISQPGGYVVQSHGEQVTVLKAVALAHGTTTFAKGDAAVILRNDPATGQRNQIPVHLKEIEHHKEEDIAMRSNDILYVPDSKGLKALAKGSEAALGLGTAITVYRVGNH